ncbi:MAG: SusD/RagB family nutrient-binding outer membrane lipoprotein, partial [Tannerella sp.]|nr:SusD/RagB family nutrient-binding outer membrane lipoprotein [Tannerella sp.]
LNHIPYYDNTYGYDPNDVTINLKPGEIDAMLAQPDYAFTGTPVELLEKIYIQQYLHFIYFSTEQMVSVRRSGVPKINTTLLKWSQFRGVPESRIPRRLEINPLNVSSLMYDIEKKAFADQGFTPGAGVGDPSVLNRERVWIDIGAPQYGEGPNILPQ